MYTIFILLQDEFITKGFNMIQKRRKNKSKKYTFITETGGIFHWLVSNNTIWYIVERIYHFIGFQGFV